MAYPEPLPSMTADELYKQAIFFYNQYEKVKKENEGLKKQLNDIELEKLKWRQHSYEMNLCSDSGRGAKHCV